MGPRARAAAERKDGLSMAKYLIVGDSQSQGTPGQYAQRKLESAGHQVQRIAHQGKGAIDYTTTDSLWSEYTGALRSFAPDAVILIFGSNDSGGRLPDALRRMKDAASGKTVWISGPPLYPEASRQRLGEGIRDANRLVFGDKWIDAYPSTPLTIPRDSLRAHLPGEGGRPWGEAIATSVLTNRAPRPQGSMPLPLVIGLSAAGVALIVGVAWFASKPKARARLGA